MSFSYPRRRGPLENKSPLLTIVRTTHKTWNLPSQIKIEERFLLIPEITEAEYPFLVGWWDGTGMERNSIYLSAG